MTRHRACTHCCETPICTHSCVKDHSQEPLKPKEQPGKATKVAKKQKEHLKKNDTHWLNTCRKKENGCEAFFNAFSSQTEKYVGRYRPYLETNRKDVDVKALKFLHGKILRRKSKLRGAIVELTYPQVRLPASQLHDHALRVGCECHAAHTHNGKWLISSHAGIYCVDLYVCLSTGLETPSRNV